MNQQVIPAHKRYDRGDFIWLFYTLFFFIEPFEHHSTPYWLENVGVLAAFILLYLTLLRFDDLRLRLPLLLAISLLGIGLYPWNEGAPVFTIFGAALLPLIISSIPWVLAGFALEILALAAIGLHFHITDYSWISDCVLIGVVGSSNIFQAQQHFANRKLLRQQEEIEALAAVAERERIARDLHDVLGHTLSVIVLKSELAARLLTRELETLSALQPTLPPQLPSPSEQQPPSSRPEPTSPLPLSFRPERSEVERPAAPPPALNLATLRRIHTEIADVEQTARTALAEVREAIGGYRARGLGAEIESARQTLATAGVTLLTDTDLRPAALSAAEETVLALALREAVTNIVRHAQATTCRLRLVAENGRHRLSVEDNGQPSTVREGNGLRGMRERVEALGGQLSLTREHGTCLLIELPARAAATP